MNASNHPSTPHLFIGWILDNTGFTLSYYEVIYTIENNRISQFAENKSLYRVNSIIRLADGENCLSEMLLNKSTYYFILNTMKYMLYKITYVTVLSFKHFVSAIYFNRL